jgi:hypothetical protein
MSSRTPSDVASRHRFFRAMVVMGGSLAVGCGGVTTGTDTASSGTKGSGGTGGLGSGGAGGSDDSGGAPGSGGMMSGGAAGAGGFLVETGGSAGQPLDAGVCLPAQWDCAETLLRCAYSADRWVLPKHCTCALGRPERADDCAANESFVCRAGAPNADGGTSSDVVPFECSCVPEQESCYQACQAAFGDFGGQWNCQEAGTRNPRDVLCGCALIVLR